MLQNAFKSQLLTLENDKNSCLSCSGTEFFCRFLNNGKKQYPNIPSLRDKTGATQKGRYVTPLSFPTKAAYSANTHIYPYCMSGRRARGRKTRISSL